jgi:outer membrane autotransporter protein
MYAAAPAMTLLYGRNLLDTLHERVGDESDQRGKANTNLGWGRLIGMSGHRDSRDTIFGAGPSFDYAFLGLQAGHDIYRAERADGSRDQAGFYFAAGSARGEVSHFDGRKGASDFDGYSLGGYWTHFGASGWYVDAVLQGTWHEVTSDARRNLRPLETSGAGVGSSLEAGYPIKLESGFFFEPQAQAIYQRVFLGDTRDAFADVRFRDVESLAGRIGARFGQTWVLNQDGMVPRTITAWLRPSIWHEFRGNPLTEFSSDAGFVPFRAQLGGTWGELDAGISGQISPATTLYASASYQSRFEGKTFAYTGKAGLRINW